MPPQSLGQTDRLTDRQTFSGSSSTEVENSNVLIALDSTSDANEILKYVTSINIYVV